MPGNILKADLPRPASVPNGSFHRNAKPLIGKRFGKLEVIEERGRNSRRCITYLCLCDCGKSVIRVGSTLLAGKSVSCGCNTQSEKAKLNKSLAQRKECTVFRREHRHYYEGAKQRGIQFALELDCFISLLLDQCAYCGQKPIRQISTRFQTALVNGIDRLDNNYGYIPANCVSCCTLCNYMKRLMRRDDFIAHCRKVAHHSRSK